MAIVTNNAHVANALRFYNERQSMYLGIARSTTPWSNESVPPAEDPSVTDLIELTGMRKCTVSLARELGEGESTTKQTVDFRGKTWVLVNDTDAYTEGANFVYVSGAISGSELPLGAYRQAGIFTGVELNEGVTANAVLPNEISSRGILNFYVNRAPQTRTSDVKTIEAFMVKF